MKKEDKIKIEKQNLEASWDIEDNVPDGTLTHMSDYDPN
jgi:hypothetical protein